jgi:arsenite-transporting ATPase
MIAHTTHWGGLNTNASVRREAFITERRSTTVSEYVLYGGKGGVGKTTCAAATALGRARAGTPTLVVSTDPAHSLSDVFDAPIGAEPTRVREGLDLWAVEVDPEDRIDRYRGQVGAALEDLEDLGITLDGDDLDDVVEAGVAPGTDEAAAMDLFVDFMDDPRYECIVFDTAPTGHTLRLLKLPDVMESAAGKLITVKSQVSSLAESVQGFLGSGGDDEPDDDGPDLDLEALQERMARVGEALRDPDRTEFRVVLVPETMAILESERLLSELDTHGVPVGGAVVNRVLEDPSPDCNRCQSRHRRHRNRIEEARERLSPPLTIVPELQEEVHGFDAVEEITGHLDGSQATDASR